MTAIIIGSGKMENASFIKSAINDALSQGARVICCDGGTSHAKTLGITPDFILGDFDSADASVLEYYRQLGVSFETYPAAKDSSDMEIGLQKAFELNARRIVFLGATGDRLDHSMSNIGLMYRCHKMGVAVELIDDNGITSLISTKTRINARINDLVSLLPFTEAVTGITTEGLLYPLNGESLEWGTTRGVSNVCVSEDAAVDVKSGILLMIQPNHS